MFTNEVPTVLYRVADQLELRLTAQAGTAPNVSNRENSKVFIVVFIVHFSFQEIRVLPVVDVMAVCPVARAKRKTLG
jgi:hypothetical protein